LFGLEAPWFTWLAALVIIAFTVGFLAVFWWKVRAKSRLCLATAASLQKLADEYAPGPAGGLSLGGCDALDRILEGVPGFGGALRRLNSQRILRRNVRGEDQIWMTQSAESAFSEAAIIDSDLNRSFYAAIPSVATGSGLLFTFLAILVALLDVRITENRVQGLELLIQGLSGKFVSSIAALAAATAYLLAEKPLQYRLRRARHALVAALDACVPVLSPTQILVDLTRDIGEQSTAFRSFNADLAGRLKQSFSESMGPTLERMVSAVENLNQLMRAAEAQKQESITGSLEGLLNKLESSMTGALSQMGNRFQESLSGGAMSQFQKVTDSLSGAASLLERMNAQAMTTQVKFAEVVELATGREVVHVEGQNHPEARQPRAQSTPDRTWLSHRQGDGLRLLKSGASGRPEMAQCHRLGRGPVEGSSLANAGRGFHLAQSRGAQPFIQANTCSTCARLPS